MAQAKRKAKAKKKSTSRAPSKRRWSARVMRESDALDLDSGVFKKGSAKAIAQSLKRSAERSTRRKSAPFRSAMSMLTFYINRGGHNLPAARLKVLDQAKEALRKLYSRQKPTPAARKKHRSRS